MCTRHLSPLAEFVTWSSDTAGNNWAASYVLKTGRCLSFISLVTGVLEPLIFCGQDMVVPEPYEDGITTIAPAENFPSFVPVWQSPNFRLGVGEPAAMVSLSCDYEVHAMITLLC
jgi:hypothetical protein